MEFLRDEFDTLVKDGAEMLSCSDTSGNLLWEKTVQGRFSGIREVTFIGNRERQISSLILTGYCHQDGEPAYNNPIPIYTNNGIWTFNNENIDLSIADLRGINEYYDIYDTVTGQINRRIEKLVLTGDEAIVLIGAGNSLYFALSLAPLNTALNDIFLCNYFKQTTISSSNTNIGANVFNSTGYRDSRLGIRFPKELNIKKVNQAKAKLKEWYDSGNPMVIYYALTNFKQEDGPTNQLTQIKGINSIKKEEGSENISISVAGWTKPSLSRSSWESVREIVRNGNASSFFPVGHEFVIHDSDRNSDNVWRVIGYDTISPADTSLQHSMILKLDRAFGPGNGDQYWMQYDGPEAIYGADQGLPPGTYHFTIQNRTDYTSDNGVSFQFTLTKNVPVNGQLVISSASGKTFNGCSISSYEFGSSTEIETTTLSIGSSGTDLGTDGSGNMNYVTRAIMGSDNWKQSNLRQYLNSSEETVSFTPTTKFDRPAYDSTWIGFLHGQPSDFVDVIATPELHCKTNNVYETSSVDGTQFTTYQTYIDDAKIFILSRPEVYGTYDDESYKDGVICEYYTGTDDTFKILKDASGNNCAQWIRSPYRWDPESERIVNTSGSISSYSANSYIASAPVCIIA